MQLPLCRFESALAGIWYVTRSCPKFPLHIERELELNLIITGEARISASSRTFAVRAGEALWLLPGHLHGLLQLSADFSMWVVMFRSELVEELRRLDSTLGSGSAAEHVSLQREEFDKLQARCFAAHTGQSNLRRFNAAAAELLLESWQSRGASRASVRDVHPAVKRAVSVLCAAEEPVPLPRLARQVGLSEYQLSRSFHRGLGVTLSFFSGFQRVQRYVRITGDGRERNTLSNALAAGFGSYSQFFRTFRAVTGWAPSEHQRLLESGALPRLAFWDEPGALQRAADLVTPGA